MCFICFISLDLRILHLNRDDVMVHVDCMEINEENENVMICEFVKQT